MISKKILVLTNPIKEGFCIIRLQYDADWVGVIELLVPRQWQDAAHLLTVPQLFYHRLEELAAADSDTIRFRCGKLSCGSIQLFEIRTKL